MSNYITYSEADEYFAANRLSYPDWANLTNDEKTVALTMATKAIDRLPFKGDKYDSSQDNEFPRGTDTNVPQDIKDACAEQALAFAEGKDQQSEYDKISVISQKFGSVSQTVNPGMLSKIHVAAGITSLAAWVLLLPYLRDLSQMSIKGR